MLAPFKFDATCRLNMMPKIGRNQTVKVWTVIEYCDKTYIGCWHDLDAETNTIAIESTAGRVVIACVPYITNCR